MLLLLAAPLAFTCCEKLTVSADEYALVSQTDKRWPQGAGVAGTYTKLADDKWVEDDRTNNNKTTMLFNYHIGKASDGNWVIAQKSDFTAVNVNTMKYTAAAQKDGTFDCPTDITLWDVMTCEGYCETMSKTAWQSMKVTCASGEPDTEDTGLGFEGWIWFVVGMIFVIAVIAAVI